MSPAQALIKVKEALCDGRLLGDPVACRSPEGLRKHIELVNEVMAALYDTSHQEAIKALESLCESVLERTGGPLPWPELENAQKLIAKNKTCPG